MAEELELVKISELPDASNVTATDLVPIVQNGVTKKVTAPIIRKYVVDSLGSAAKASTTDFEPSGSVLEVDLKSQARADEQNKRIDRIEVAAYLLKNNKVFKAYRSKALMVADVANIPANSLLHVLNDSANNPETNDFNGQYHYDGNDFLKLPDYILALVDAKDNLVRDYADQKAAQAIQSAAFDAQLKADEALQDAKQYSDQKIETIENIIGHFVVETDSENLYEWKDNAGNVVLALNKKCQLVSYDEDTKRSILLTNQEDIKELQKFVDELNLNNISVLLKLLATSNSSDLYTFDDSDGNIVLRLTKSGMIRSGQIDGLHNAVDALEYLKKLTKQSDDSKLIRFEDAEKNLLGYVDKFNNWVFNGVDVLNEINELKKFKNKAQTVTALKQIAVKAPDSVVQIYLTDVDYLPESKGTQVSAKAELHIDGETIACYTALEVQGSSSAAYPKKNWTLALYSDQKLSNALKMQIGSVPAHDEWVFKSNYVDFSNVRNVGANNFWEAMVQSRNTLYKREVDQVFLGKSGVDAVPTNATGHVVGYSALLYINDKFYGIGNLCIGKKYFNYNLNRKNPKNIQIDWGMGQADLTKLSSSSASVYEFKSPKAVTQVTIDCLRAWDVFASSEQSSFSENASKFLNQTNVIDYWLFSDLTYNYDGLGKNFQFVSWNGTQFYFMPYDLDSTFGSNFSGTGTIPATAVLTKDDLPSATADFWNKVKNTYANEMRARYKELRDLKIFDESFIYNTCYELASKFPYDLVLLERERWPDSPSQYFSSIFQIANWTKQRLIYLDNLYQYNK